MIGENALGYPPYEASSPCNGPPPDGCVKVGYQYADICVPVEVKSNAEIGKIETECCGEPMVSCKQNAADCTCEIRIVQKVCIKIPVRYSIAARAGESTIDCACGCNDL
ncbi:MAG: hypothetical protein ACOYKJ_05840 [Candidatus Howiella sp.]|jgi:hypothetical protein